MAEIVPLDEVFLFLTSSCMSSGVSGGKLAAETCRAGGLGFIAAGHLNSKESLQNLEREIDIFRTLARDDDPLCIGFIGFSTFSSSSVSTTTNNQNNSRRFLVDPTNSLEEDDELKVKISGHPRPRLGSDESVNDIPKEAPGANNGWTLFETVMEVYQPNVIQLFAPAISFLAASGSHKSVVQLAHSYGSLVMAQVGTYEEALQAMEHGVDAIIAQGAEAGGHGVRMEFGSSTLSLTTRLVNHMAIAQTKKIPILAAGGIVDGKGVAAMLSLGADGVVLGTRLWASTEAKGPDSYKQALVEAKSSDDRIRTRVFDSISSLYSPIQWPSPFDSSGALRNETTSKLQAKQAELDEALKCKNRGGEVSEPISAFMKTYQQAQKEQNPNIAVVYAGGGVGEIDSIDNAYDIILKIEEEAVEQLQSVPKKVILEDEEPLPPK